MGAWIETQSFDTFEESADVAPRVGAWIETFAKIILSVMSMSHPEWVRGLKHTRQPYNPTWSESHPEWVRGLKLTIAMR